VSAVEHATQASLVFAMVALALHRAATAAFAELRGTTPHGAFTSYRRLRWQHGGDPPLRGGEVAERRTLPS
jgi:hypothetical protein